MKYAWFSIPAFFLVSALWIHPAVAETKSVYKCVGKGGVASFQSEPCTDPTHVKKVWNAEPERLTNAQQWQRYNTQQKAANDAAYLRSLAHGDVASTGAGAYRINIRNSQCQRARRDRDTFYANTPKRKSKDMERWNKYVYDACK